MVATSAVIEETPETVVREMAEHMRTLATNGDWEEVENLAVRLRAAVMNVPEGQRRNALLAVQRVTEQVSAEAATAQRDVTGRLRALRRGQKATKAYELR